MNLLAAMRYLIALDKHRHFGRAAKAAHITQPALSNALRALEDEFGVAIIKRSRTYGGLTEEGEAVLETARRTLHEIDLLTQELQSTAEFPRGPLRMASVPTAVPLLMLFAAMLRRANPGIVPTVLTMSSPQIEAQLEDLSLDLALGYTERLTNAAARLRSWPQTHERYYFLRQHPGLSHHPRPRDRADLRDDPDPKPKALRYGSPITWSEAATHALCQLTPEMHNRAIIDSVLAPTGTPPQPAIETNSLLAVTLAVAAGDVCAILPGAMIAAVREHSELEARPLIEPDVRTPLGFIALAQDRPSRTLQAAIKLMAAPEWSAALTIALEQHAGEGSL
jgi:DNA-binding transcriptional LysR family regulator